ncbi:hypothetical protein OAory_01093220 [Aspergillus oryzae]|uniref:Uncharacterized protein n=1 Tax=Aspergillus oryzae TaxID=5062 RepID=A0A1S9DDP4_ASPOZ|nr:uncharacterized protein G4B84_010886 [Aspergillus flavus NRRL3357]OOO07119.1 hypothetical protein OAory_01093220 [Aspergillus oryzae]QMW35395.1 hypothetical protein G4B84_010886 [Aspergillus flavus NRRL3357]QMW47457.1 hypothetical protein G4B11_010936 [Aspergillus flavus]
MFGFSWFKSSKEEETSQQPTWNPNTLTMEQPTSPAAPNQQQVVTEQPASQEQMNMSLRGGGGGGVCCGIADKSSAVAPVWLASSAVRSAAKVSHGPHLGHHLRAVMMST